MTRLFDNFAPDFSAVREAVTSGPFTTETGPDGAKYTGISAYPVPQWFDRISELLNQKIVPKLSCFRLNLKGELPHSWVHSDDICAKFASVLYMNEPQQCYGGTAFWEHKHLHIDALPSREELAEQKVDSDEYYRMIEKEWKEQSVWHLKDFIQMRANRFITYPTRFFHSRYPFEAFGDGPKDGRLIWICFYDLETK